MRYNLINERRVEPIKSAVVDGFIYSSPSDEFLDAHGIGYPFVPVQQPPSEEFCWYNYKYVIKDGVITMEFFPVYYSKEDLKNQYQGKINQIFHEAEEFKNSGEIEYPVTGKKYIPRWVFEFYNTVMICSSAMFPTVDSTIDVSAVDGTSDPMTQVEFMALYQYLIGYYMTVTNEQNAQIRALYAKIAALDEDSDSSSGENNSGTDESETI